jgi:nitroreductase
MNPNAALLKAIIENRRTIKPEEFNGSIIPEEIISAVMESANWAPTHGLTEPWRFILFSGSEGVRRFGKLHADLYKAETPKEIFLQKKYESILHKPDNASHVAAIIMKRGNRENIPECEEMAATACAAQNILLMAAAYKLAVYWGTGGMCYHPSMKKALHLKEADRIMGFLYFGYSGKHPQGVRNSSIDEKITRM